MGEPLRDSSGDSLGHRPEGKWQFDQTVADCFDDMLARSIPQYRQMRQACHDLALKYARDDTAIVDLGCSRGAGVAPLIDALGCRNFFVCVDESLPMIEAVKERFAGLIKCGIVSVRRMDLREAYPPLKASVTMAVLTLQFVPIEYRQAVVWNCFRHTVPGGAMIVVEKVLGATAEINGTMIERYHTLKQENGYSPEAVQTKQKSLENVLVPVTARWNEDLLRTAGFAQVDCFWRWMNFAGWIAVKE